MKNELIEEILTVPDYKWKSRIRYGDGYAYTYRTHYITLPKVTECSVCYIQELPDDTPSVCVDGIVVTNKDLEEKIIRKVNSVRETKTIDAWGEMTRKLNNKWLKRKKQLFS